MADGSVIERSTARRPRAHDQVLSPKLFRRLELIARSQGCVLQVREAAEMGNNWGCVNFMAQGVYEDLRAPKLKCYETALIDIAPRFHVSQFHGSCRPELDWSQVPSAKAWEFLVWHEIGHLKDNIKHFGVVADKDPKVIASQKEWSTALYVVNEVLADRFAWNAVFPDQPIPICPRRTHSAEYVSEWLERLDARYGRSGRREMKPLPTDPLCHVPWQHVKRGIPYERPEDRESFAKALTEARAAVIDRIIDDAASAGVRLEHVCEGKPHIDWSEEMQKRIAAKYRLEKELECFSGSAIADRVVQRLPRMSLQHRAFSG